jgi:DNA repair protein RecN (Recombination protein N)
MLTHLTVQNFALVDHLELEFESGMTVVTGETGAGKSIILDALGLTLGDRADTGLIADAANRAEIHATFDISDNLPAKHWLAAHELPIDNAGECILRRTLSADGRSRGFINGSPSTVADLKTLGEMLIDIHSQHEHQSLLKKDNHRRMLDEFGDVLPLASQVHELWEQFNKARKRLESLRANNAEQTARVQLLAYQAEELEQLAIEADEHISLEQEQQQLSHVDEILRNCDAALQACELNEEGNILSQLSQALHLLQAIELDALAPVTELFISSKIQLEEAVSDLQRFADTIEADPKRLLEVEARLTSIYDIARKHRIKPGDIQAFTLDIQAEIKSLDNVDAEIDSLTASTQTLSSSYRDVATRLSHARIKAATTLECQVNEQLVKLGMHGAIFKANLTPIETSLIAPGGLEEVEFLISTNPGQAPRSLNKIASGGELSRISLAIQVVTADTSKVPSLVFDEVDVGIGGAVAEVVGSLLRNLGGKAQIVCVTHLPQVAAQGHQHYLVTKSTGAGKGKNQTKARTEIATLGAEGKIEEIARMLGGVELTQQSLDHAKAMYNNAQAN